MNAFSDHFRHATSRRRNEVFDDPELARDKLTDIASKLDEWADVIKAHCLRPADFTTVEEAIWSAINRAIEECDG